MSRHALTRDLAWSAAQDAADTQMRAAGRSKWSPDDYRLAVETFDRLWPEERDYEQTTACGSCGGLGCVPGEPEDGDHSARPCRDCNGEYVIKGGAL